MKKVLSILLVLMLSATLLASCGGKDTPAQDPVTPETPEATNVSVVLLLTQNLGSQSFVDVIDKGCKQAVDELGIQYAALESLEVANAADAIRAVVAQGANLIIASAAQYNEVIMEMAEEFPDVNFCSIDSDGASITKEFPNVYEVTYKEHESAFLQGAFCALMSETDKVAQLMGQEGGVMTRFSAGFRSGAKYINGIDPTIVIVGWADVNKGYETATMLFDQGYDWIANCAGGSNLGAFQASEEKGGNNWVCGAADGQFHLMPSRIVASQVKTINTVAFDTIKAMVNGQFPGGTKVQLGLKEGGVGLIFNPDLVDTVPQDVMDTIDQLTEDISNGTLVVPSSPDAVESFDLRIA